MTKDNLVLINLLTVKPGKQDALLALLTRNIETVVSKLDGWKKSQLIAGKDGATVVIYSEWATEAAVAAMRTDPRMQAYFPKILELATFDSILGEAVLT